MYEKKCYFSAFAQRLYKKRFLKKVYRFTDTQWRLQWVPMSGSLMNEFWHFKNSDTKNKECIRGYFYLRTTFLVTHSMRKNANELSDGKIWVSFIHQKMRSEILRLFWPCTFLNEFLKNTFFERTHVLCCPPFHKLLS